MTTLEPLTRSDLLPIAASQKTFASVNRVGRVEFLAATRGAAVLYIVFGHIVENFRQLDLTSPPLWDETFQIYLKLDSATAGTRLPILILMTGLFLERSLTRGTRRFIVSRAQTILWPLILWGLVQAAIFALNPQLTPWHGQQEREGLILLGTSLASFDLLWAIRAWELAADQLWFLDMLLVFLVLYLFVRRLPRLILLAMSVLLFIASLAIEPPTPKSNPALSILIELGPYFMFFCLGTVMSDWIVKRNANISRVHAAVAGCLFLAMTVALLFVEPLRWWRPLTFLSALPAIPLLFMAGKWLAKSPVRTFFLWAGQASLLLLCLHMLCIAFVLAVARAVGVTSPPLLVLLASVGGVGLCFVIDHALRRTGLSAALGFRPAK